MIKKKLNKKKLAAAVLVGLFATAPLTACEGWKHGSQQKHNCGSKHGCKGKNSCKGN